MKVLGLRYIVYALLLCEGAVAQEFDSDAQDQNVMMKKKNYEIMKAREELKAKFFRSKMIREKMNHENTSN